MALLFSPKSKPQSPSLLGVLTEAASLGRDMAHGGRGEIPGKENRRCLARVVGTGPFAAAAPTWRCHLKSRISERTILRIHGSNNGTRAAQLESG